MNIIKHRYLYFLISLLVIVPGIAALIAWGFPLAIDFTGGSLLEVGFNSAATMPTSEDIANLYKAQGVSDAQVQTSTNSTTNVQGFIIRSAQIDETKKDEIVSAMKSTYSADVVINRFDTVGPIVGAEVAKGAIYAVIAAALAIILYITYAFRGVEHAFRYGVSAIIAMLHDVAVVCGMEALLAHFMGWEVDSLFLTALLTVIGFSVHDTIVVFDRIRENSHIYRRVGFTQVVNHSTIQTLARSINTQLTVLLCLLALALFGGVTIRHFVVILLIGVFSGTYSSIFNASPVLVVWENREWKYWFKRDKMKELLSE
jgi:preprotein translocase subunit SecF